MLTLKSIVKNYTTGDTTVGALKGVSMSFRKSEFVSILGPSGCGKTTLLNIIGGLDRYTSGDLVINGRSTKSFGDRDWDSYRNHSIGFVFQSYNLIPHQSVLSNVELALTLSGVSREERRRRATEALERVGLGDQLHKRPNQMSGGQMQRVAIARALVNDPDILLADEPTGALDSETSVQIMDILKEISGDKLIIMVTHNPELAEKYSNRIIRLFDGEITDDSNPCEEELTEASQTDKKVVAQKKPSMSFLTAVSLSFNNLLTKKARTFLTSFAGSIGIIGIALILSLSNGVNLFIESVQKETLASSPIAIQAESVDASALLTAMLEVDTDERGHELDKVYANTVMYRLVNSLNDTETQKNNLVKFKQFLDKEMDKSKSKTDLYKYASAIRYTYDFDMNIYTKNESGAVIKSNMSSLIKEIYGIGSDDEVTTVMPSVPGGASDGMSSGGMMSFSAMDTWEEMLSGQDGKAVSDLLYDQYDVIYGKWPEKYNEVVLVVDENNEITDMTLYALGLKSADEIRQNIQDSAEGKKVEVKENSWSYKEICGTDFRLVPSSDRYSFDTANGQYIDLDSNDAGMKYLYDNGIKLKVVGIIRPNPDATVNMLRGSIGYTQALAKHIIDRANNSDIVKKQLKATDIDILTGKKFKPEKELTEAEKADLMKTHVISLDNVKKAELYKKLAVIPDEEYLKTTTATYLASMSEQDKTNLLVQAVMAQTGMDANAVTQYIAQLDEATLASYIEEAVKASVTKQYAQQITAQLASMSETAAAAAFDDAIAKYDDKALAKMYDETISDDYSASTYEANLRNLGYVDMSSPAAVNIFSATFDNKEEVSRIITDYNKKAKESDHISYTDYVAMLFSGVTVIFNAVSYVLIAFVSISLVVSSIMIGIITYISVLERTKEIGVLRSIGASKKDITRVFNAETLIVGFAAGAIGIIVTVLACLPINLIIHVMTGLNTINASLPLFGGIALMLISMLLTFVAGLIPSRIAAKKDPVVALRSE